MPRALRPCGPAIAQAGGADASVIWRFSTACAACDASCMDTKEVVAMIKTKDRSPAPRRSAEDWTRIVEQWCSSKASAREFCRARGLSFKTFEWWRWALLTRGGSPHRHSPARPSKSALPLRVSPSVALTPAFIEMVPPVGTTSSTGALRRPSGVEVLVAGRRGDRRVRVDVEFDSSTLRRVVATLEEV